MLRKIIYMSLVALLALPLSAQNRMLEMMRTDSLYEFRFVAGKDLFYVPYGDNRAEYDKYSVIDGVRVRQENGMVKNYWGINQLGITLVWKPF